MSDDHHKAAALDYHEFPNPGKIEVIPTTETGSQRDLSLAYSPGVAEPCLAIADTPEDVFRYTAKGNLVAVISNGTAVLGLGDLGPEASKPVMEGKGLLFKIYAGIDVFDLELNTTNIDEFVRTVKILEPTFGGINLEDIKAPESFEIEERLKKELHIPVMHDDQHGTAIISGAALLNALELVGKPIEKIRMVVSGAGAAAISSTKLAVQLGVDPKNIVMTDSKGVIRKDRENLDKYKKQFATERDVDSLEDAMLGADVFYGLSVGNTVTPDMLLGMANDPIVFAMANPDPEIAYDLAMKTRDDVIMATGRSDHPNQVNNVLGFPYIFRGALDVRATAINEEMKLAAVRALADLAKEPVPEIVNNAYNKTNITFGKDYIIPKPVDPRLLTTVAPAVAKAAMDSGVAGKPIEDWDAYKTSLELRLGRDDSLMRVAITKAKQDPKRVVFSDADNVKVLKAAQIVKEEGCAIPILLGNEKKINRIIEQNKLSLEGVRIIDPKEPNSAPYRLKYGHLFYERRKRKGVNQFDAERLMRDRNHYGMMMVQDGEADAFISGMTRDYPQTIRPALQIIGTEIGVNRVAGMYTLLTKHGPVFFADCTVNVNPSAEDIADITHLTAEAVRKFNIEPRVAPLSYSNFGSSEGAEPDKMRHALDIIKALHPDLIVDGELQANFASNKELLLENYPFSDLAEKGANTFIFPNLSSSNIAYKLMQELGESTAIGPMLLGLKKSIHILQLGSSVSEIVNMATIAVVDAQGKA